MGVQSYLQHLSPGATPQSQPILGREAEMAPNAAGGYGFVVDDWTALDRWLILGSDGGTHYASAREITLDNAATLRRCIATDGLRTVARIVEISDAGRAPRNDPAILGLALCAKAGNEQTRRAAYAAVPKVCRIGTHLFSFAEAIQSLGGWGRGARRAVASWYTEREPDSLAYQLVKYRQRNGWTHRDLLRLSHPAPSPLLAWAAGKGDSEAEGLPEIIEGFGRLQGALNPKTAADLIRAYNLPRECVPTELLNSPEVWMALLEKMPATALLRNLGNLTKLGVVAPFSTGLTLVLAHLSDSDRLRKARIHPMAVLLALKVYASGTGMHGSGAWSPVRQVVDALDDAFYASMSNVTPSGKRLLAAVDVSGSMGWETCAGYPITPAEAAAAMALITVKTDPSSLIVAFHTQVGTLNLSPRMRMDDVQRELAKHSGGTDCAAPVVWATREKISADAIVLYTDNETWAGSIHPAQAMQAFRRTVGTEGKLVSAAFTATRSSIADKMDPLMLDCVGLDVSTPEIVRSFIAGEF